MPPKKTEKARDKLHLVQEVDTSKPDVFFKPSNSALKEYISTKKPWSIQSINSGQPYCAALCRIKGQRLLPRRRSRKLLIDFYELLSFCLIEAQNRPWKYNVIRKCYLTSERLIGAVCSLYLHLYLSLSCHVSSLVWSNGSGVTSLWGVIWYLLKPKMMWLSMWGN